MTDTRHTATLTVQITFEGDYYLPTEMVNVATQWIDGGLEDRDDVTGWTVTGTVQQVTDSPAAAAENDDMRREVVLRELNQGALAGMQVEVTERAVDLVLAALDRYDAWAAARTTEQPVGDECPRCDQDTAACLCDLGTPTDS